jgi:GNAT superfamily N-acetyltransferase
MQNTPPLQYGSSQAPFPLTADVSSRVQHEIITASENGETLALSIVPANVPLPMHQSQEVIDLFRAVYGDRYHKSYTTTIAELELCRTAGQGASLLITRADKVIAYATLTADSKHRCKFERVVVAPESRGLGVGKLLVRRGTVWAETQGYSWLWAEVVTSHATSERLFTEVGFQPVGLNLGKYLDYFGSGVRESTLVLFKELSPGKQNVEEEQKTGLANHQDSLLAVLSSNHYEDMSQVHITLNSEASVATLERVMEEKARLFQEEYIAITMTLSSLHCQAIRGWFAENDFVFAYKSPNTNHATYQRFRPYEWDNLMAKPDLSLNTRYYLEKMITSCQELAIRETVPLKADCISM